MDMRQHQLDRGTVRRIAAAAGQLFVASGYRATTMSAIAEAADVAIQTIYNTVGSKSAVLNLVLEETVSGPEAPRPVPEFMQERAERLPDAAGVIEALADWFVEVHQRSGELFRIIREAAAVDPAVAIFEAERELRRLTNYHLAAQILAAKDGARPRMKPEEAAATIWSVGHPLVYRRLVVEGEWSPDRYRRWIVDTLTGSLLAA